MLLKIKTWIAFVVCLYIVFLSGNLILHGHTDFDFRKWDINTINYAVCVFSIGTFLIVIDKRSKSKLP